MVHSICSAGNGRRPSGGIAVPGVQDMVTWAQKRRETVNTGDAEAVGTVASGSSLLDGRVPDAVGRLDQGLAEPGEAAVQLPPADDLAEVVDGEEGEAALR